MTALERGQEFLDGFKKLPYNRDRIGQSFVMPVSPKREEVKDQKQEIKSKASKEAQAAEQSAMETGRESLERFKKLGYSRDRIGQTVLLKAIKKENESTEATTSATDGHLKAEKPDVSLDEMFSAYYSEEKRYERKKRIYNLVLFTALFFINSGFALIIGWMGWKIDMYYFVNSTGSILPYDTNPTMSNWVVLMFFPCMFLTYKVVKVLKIEDY